MRSEFIPQELEYSLRQLGYRSNAYILWQQAFRFFREKYNLHYSIGVTNICVYHVPMNNYHTTGMIQDCKSHDEAELECLKKFVEIVKTNPHLWQNL